MSFSYLALRITRELPLGLFHFLAVALVLFYAMYGKGDSWLSAFDIILILAALLIALVVGFSYVLFCYLFSSPERSRKIPSSRTGTPRFEESRKGLILMSTLPVEDCYITSRDGLRLHSYLYPAEDEKSKKFLIGIHGYKAYAKEEFSPFLKFYRDLGFNVLLPDDRAHKPSEGKYIGFGVLDRLDAVDWAKYVEERFGDDVEILLHGISMGSATVMAASAEDDLPSAVFGIIADCGYTTAEEILKWQLRKRKLPAKLIMPGLEGVTKLLAGYGFTEHTPLEAVKHSRVPILFVHGGKDRTVPLEMAHQLYDACSSRKELLYSENAHHAETIAIDRARYEETIRRFFSL